MGARLVSEVANAWTRKFQFTILQVGFDGQSAFHYECIFSTPSNGLPVPSCVLTVKFALVIPSFAADPRLLYSFEEGDLRNEWMLKRDGTGQWRAFSPLNDRRFEEYMERLVYEKDQVRGCGVNLRTDFEASRLEKPPAYEEDSSDESGSNFADDDDEDGYKSRHVAVVAPTEATSPNQAQSEMALAIRTALQAAGLYCDKVAPPSSLAELLASIFDAADEDNLGELPHYEVVHLLSATLPGFGLELWDIHLLMTSAQENDDGFIECKAFVQAAPEIVQALRKRRMAFAKRGLPGVEVPQEAVKHCFTDEMTATAAMITKIFEHCVVEEPSSGKWQAKNPDASHATNDKRHHTHGHGLHHQASLHQDEEEALVGIKRRSCHNCIASLPELLSPQEVMRLMQMLPEDEDGFVMIDELVEHLEHLRTGAILNALVESDVLSLRTHLVLQFRRLGLAEDKKMFAWVMKDALLQADQVCLTRRQIHTLLCLAVPDAFGRVDIEEFLGMCCVIIPHMFDAKLFVETAERLILEQAENQRQAENAEMMALTAARISHTGHEGEESLEKVEIDLETVERTLQQILSMNDDCHRNPPALKPEVIYEILGVNEKEIQGLQLSAYEITGFAAEMQPDTEGFVPYVEHVKKWVPIIFEQRKDRLLSRYLESTYEALNIAPPNLAKMEVMFEVCF
jgi:Ca2+-binding EF-hand superfamily protein